MRRSSPVPFCGIQEWHLHGGNRMGPRGEGVVFHARGGGEFFLALIRKNKRQWRSFSLLFLLRLVGVCKCVCVKLPWFLRALSPRWSEETNELNKKMIRF